MLIFIDESGTFARSEKASSPSVAAAFVVHEGGWPKLQDRYAKLRRQLPKSAAGEVKGSLLNEAQVAAVASLLRKAGALAFAVVLDTSAYDEADFLGHRQNFADSLIRGIPPDANPHLVKNVHASAAAASAMKEPLYAQARATIVLASSLIAHSIPYYALRQPKALGAFDWTIDGKDIATNDWEAWWRSLASPLLQSQSLSKPLGLPKGGDYRFLTPFLMETPDYLEAHFPESVTSRRGVNLAKIFFDKFRFSAAIEPGLEMADVLANAVRRALVGHLGLEGWEQFAAMMLPTYGFQLTTLGADKPARALPYKAAALRFVRGGRDMLTAAYRRSAAD